MDGPTKSVWVLCSVNLVFGAGIAVGVFSLLAGSPEVALFGALLAVVATGMCVTLTALWQRLIPDGWRVA